MKNMNIYLKSLVAGFLLTAGVVQAADVAVIVNSSNSEALSIEQIKNIYSDRVTTWHSGQKIEIYNLSDDQDTREIFAQKVLGMSGQASAAAESRRKINNTLKNPSKTKRAILVISSVARKRNAIGYVPMYLVKDEERVHIVRVLKEKE